MSLFSENKTNKVLNIVILGNGAREDAITKSFQKSRHKTFRLETNSFDEIYSFCVNQNIDLVVPSSETYLCQGITDHLNSCEKT